MQINLRACTILVLVAAASLVPVAHAQVLRQVTRNTAGDLILPQLLVDEGREVLILTNIDPYGMNPTGAYQIFAFDTTSGIPEQVTAFAEGVEPYFQQFSASIDGAWLTFAARGDLTGQNADMSAELFVMHRDGSALQQLSDAPSTTAPGFRRLVMSDEGNRIVFVSQRDITGDNPDGDAQLYVVDRDGSGLRQLTSGPGAPGDSIWAIDIDASGSRIVYGRTDAELSAGIFGVHADGTGLRVLEDEEDTAGVASMFDALRISGDGTRVVTTFVRPVHHPNFVRLLDWNGTLLDFQYRNICKQLPGVAQVEVTHDGSTVFMVEGCWPGVERWSPDGVELVVAADGSGNEYAYALAIAADGSRLVTLADGDGLPQNPDRSMELLVTDVPDGELRQVTGLATFGLPLGPDIAADGSRIAYLQPLQDGTSLDAVSVNRAGTDVTTNSQYASGYEREGEGPVRDVALSRDGQFLFWSSLEDDGIWLGVHEEDSFWPSITDGCGVVTGRVQTSDGSDVVVGEGPCGVSQRDVVTVAPPFSAPETVVCSSCDESRVSADGEWVVFRQLAGDEASNRDEPLFRVRRDGTGLAPVGTGREPDVSGDGAWIVYRSSGDPLGTNADGNAEIFAFEPPTGLRRQLTDSVDGDSLFPRITNDGTHVYFVSSAPFDEPRTVPQFQLFRLRLADRAIERAQGLGFVDTPEVPVDELDTATITLEVDDSGSLVFQLWNGNFGGDNFDVDREIWLVDWTEPNRLYVSGPAPTRLDWSADPRALRYDVIRGDLDALRQGPPGQLGMVVCLRDDAPLPTTADFPDVLDPEAGRAFFYLWRGSGGSLLGPGSYGGGTAGDARLAGDGDCPQP